MKIAFLGSSEFALPTLRRLVERGDVAVVVTQPDRPAGRKRALTPTPVGAWAAEQGLDPMKPEDANAPDVIAALAAMDLDAMVVIAFGQYLKQRLVRLPRWGAINLHASVLPACRGAAPIQWSMVRGEPTGNSVIRISPRMDAGAVLAADVVEPGETETAGEFHDRLATLGVPLVERVLDDLAAGTAIETAQDDALATDAPKLSGRDAWVDFSLTNDQVRLRINGLSPYPGVRATLTSEKGDVEVKLLRARSIDDTGSPGSLIDAGMGHIACGRGAVAVIDVQPLGRGVMTWHDFARGHQLRQGSTVHSGERSDGGT